MFMIVGWICVPLAIVQPSFGGKAESTTKGLSLPYHFLHVYTQNRNVIEQLIFRERKSVKGT